MGYRSEVAFACDPIIKDVIETVAEWCEEFKELVEYGDDMSPDDHGRWRFDQVKWYESYTDVQVIENIMIMCDNVDLPGLAYDSYAYIRLGEEMEDVEMKGDTSAFDLYVNRSIDI